MSINKKQASENQVLVSQLPEYVRSEWSVYCSDYSEDIQTQFLKELVKLKDRKLEQQCFFDLFTYFTYHFGDGREFKQYTGNELLDERLNYLYHCYLKDPKVLRELHLERMFKFLDEEIKKHGVNVSFYDRFMNECKWRRMYAENNYTCSGRKYLDFYDLDEETKDLIWDRVDYRLQYCY